MSVSTKAFPTLGGWHPSYKELFLEFTGSDGKKYRTGLRPKEYPFYAGAPIINGVPDFSQAVFLVDKYGNVRMKNAYIEGTIIAGANSEIDWSYIKNVLVKDAQIESLSADKITAGNGIINALTIKNSLTIGSGGCIRQGQTAYDTGIGFWLGDVNGTPKFSIGNSTGNKLTWDGSTLTVSGVLNAASGSSIKADYITAGTLTGSRVQTAQSGRRVVMETQGDYSNSICFYDEDNNFQLSIYENIIAWATNPWLISTSTDILEIRFPVPISDIRQLLFTRGTRGDVKIYAGIGSIEIGSDLVPSGTNNLGSPSYKWANLYISGTVNTTYLAASYLSQPLNANGYSISNLNSLYCSYLYANYLGQSLNANSYNISNIGSLYCSYLYASYLGQSLNANGYNISNVATLSCSSLSCSGTVYGSLLNIGASSTYNYIAGTLKTYSIHPASNNYYELGSSSYKWYRIYVSYINGVGDIILENHIRPASLSLNLNVGTADYYFNEINAKYFTDRGCLAWFEDGVELNNGKKVSDLEAIKSIKPSEKKKTIYGVPQLDYSTLPKVVYRPAPIDEKGNKRGEDGAELTALISIMLGAIKELDKKVENLENKFNELEKSLT